MAPGGERGGLSYFTWEVGPHRALLDAELPFGLAL